jgi:hypothetical protein
MTKSMPYIRAVPFSRPAGRRRIEVFSPKIGRRLSLGGYDAFRTWLVIEANPGPPERCERKTQRSRPSALPTLLQQATQVAPDHRRECRCRHSM